MSRDRFLTALHIAATAAAAEIVLVAGWTLRTSPAEAALYAGFLWSLVKCGPLLAVMPGLVRGSARAATWLCFILCAYFLAAVVTAASPPPLRWLGLVEILVITTGFVAGLLATRWGRGRAEPPARMS